MLIKFTQMKDSDNSSRTLNFSPIAQSVLGLQYTGEKSRHGDDRRPLATLK